jgi:hypothetical protein
MINLICQATWIANLFRIKKISSSRGFLYFGLHTYNEIFIGKLS